jgi:hypothetical protein
MDAAAPALETGLGALAAARGESGAPAAFEATIVEAAINVIARVSPSVFMMWSVLFFVLIRSSGD